MKFLVLILFFSNFLAQPVLKAQDGNNIILKYKCVPTSTLDYSIEIDPEKFILSKTEIIANKKGRFKRLDTSNYIHHFNLKEKDIIDSIIKINRLDSVGLYRDRITEWGTLWNIRIQQNSVTYNIDLPNYTNAGLESLIHFIVCLIPVKELPRFECKKCN